MRLFLKHSLSESALKTQIISSLVNLSVQHYKVLVRYAGLAVFNWGGILFTGCQVHHPFILMTNSLSEGADLERRDQTN